MGCIDCAKTIANGVAGLAKVAAQAVGVPVDQAPPETIRLRLDVCRECDKATKAASRMDRPSKGLHTFSICLECECLIAAKTRIASEKCPLAKW